MLIDHGGITTIKNNSSVLEEYCSMNWVDGVEVLLEYGVDPKICDKKIYKTYIKNKVPKKSKSGPRCKSLKKNLNI